MTQNITFNENGLMVEFAVMDDGTVRLARFAPDDVPSRISSEEENDALPVIELQITGKSAREMHGYKHNAGSASLDLHYVRHEFTDSELILTLDSQYGLEARYHMQFYKGVPVVSVYTELENKGTEALPVEYVSSFIYQNLCGDGNLPYFEKTDVYVPRSSWDCETRWQKQDIELLNVSRMMVNGFNTPGHGCNRFAYSGLSSWSTVEYLPMGLVHDREVQETYCFQIENSGPWHVEYDSELGGRLTLALSGPTEHEHGWWCNLKPGQTFTTVPAAFGVVKGGIDSALGALTLYRRAMRRPNADDEHLNVVFNDYMNCLMGDPTEENEKAIIDKAAEMGCEYYCLDAGWYDKGDWWETVGEWQESPERFPNGLKSVCDYARSKGLVMGLWLEIEVMGVNCPLAKTLPDSWFVCRHGRRHIDRNRYLLDFRNPEVRTYCRNVIERLIADYGVGYFKIDYNVTMGYGSDLDTDSCAGAILDHYSALYQWYEEIFAAHPDLVIENCGSGAQRMDYGMLRLLSLQSTSDQTDYIYNSYIAGSVASAVTPEQGGMWVYPYEDETEHVVYNMVNGLLLRPYMSGMVWKLGDKSMSLLAEGVSLYKSIRRDVRRGLPFFPLGLNTIKDDVLAYGLELEDHAYLSVFTPKTDTAVIPLKFDGKKVTGAEVIYPSEANCDCELSGDMLRIRMPQKAAARLMRLTLESS